MKTKTMVLTGTTSATNRNRVQAPPKPRARPSRRRKRLPCLSQRSAECRQTIGSDGTRAEWSSEAKLRELGEFLVVTVHVPARTESRLKIVQVLDGELQVEHGSTEDDGGVNIEVIGVAEEDDDTQGQPEQVDAAILCRGTAQVASGGMASALRAKIEAERTPASGTLRSVGQLSLPLMRTPNVALASPSADRSELKTASLTQSDIASICTNVHVPSTPERAQGRPSIARAYRRTAPQPCTVHVSGAVGTWHGEHHTTLCSTRILHQLRSLSVAAESQGLARLPQTPTGAVTVSAPVRRGERWGTFEEGSSGAGDAAWPRLLRRSAT
ncbi:hypothetical protein OG21DRAFT_1606209, partial [Imleria badia]